jgi:hypothetical protein
MMKGTPSMSLICRLILLSVVLPLFLGCGGQSGTTSRNEIDLALSIQSGAQKSAFAPVQLGIQRILLEITGLGLDKISLDVTVTDETIEVLEDVVVSSGSRRFEAFAHDAEGLAYSGFVETVLAGGRRVVDITMVPVPRVSRLSLGQAVPGDTIKISGRVFGTPPEGEVAPNNSRVTVGGVQAEIVRWSDTAVVAIIPALPASDTPVPVLVEFGDQKSDAARFTITIQDQVIGVGGRDTELNLDDLLFPLPGGMRVTDNKVALSSGATLSVALSGDGSTVAEARSGDAQDVAVSRDGSVILTANGTALIRKTIDSVPSTISSTDCIHEVAISSDGNTAAAIGAPCSGGIPSKLYRIDNVTGDASLTLVSPAGSGETYTDVAISEDADTVLVGWKTESATGGVHRVLDFNGGAPIAKHETLASGLALARVNHVDVDLSADGITAIVAMQDAAIPKSVIFQIWDADLSTSQTSPPTAPIEFAAVVGVAVNSGGSLGVVRTFDDDPDKGPEIHRFDQFNVTPVVLSAPMDDPLLNTALESRGQDQIDLQ